jgi:hypothetical protein
MLQTDEDTSRGCKVLGTLSLGRKISIDLSFVRVDPCSSPLPAH